jgi:hypothetical protein
MRPPSCAQALWLALAVVLLGCGATAGGLAVFPSATPRPDRALRLRVHVSGTYAAQDFGTHGHLREIIHDADAILSSSIGAHLVLVEIVDGWKVDVGQADHALRALMDADSGAGVDIVVGMLGAAAAREDGCNGMATLGGDYMVVRSEDAEPAREHALAVVAFLHELGHTLGASHDDEPGSIMSASGASASSSFSDASVQVIRSGLARHGIAATRWSGHRQATGLPAQGDPRTEMTSADRATLERAFDAERRGDESGAWDAAEPLFGAYPSVLAVQDLRCRLAQARGMAWSEVRAQCSALMQLMMAGASPLQE